MSVIEGIAFEFVANTATYYEGWSPEELSEMVQHLIVEAAADAALNEGAGDAIEHNCWVQVRPFLDVGVSIQVYHIQRMAGRLINAEGDPIS